MHSYLLAHCGLHCGFDSQRSGSLVTGRAGADDQLRKLAVAAAQSPAG